MTEMVLPQFGMGMADGTIIAWHKAVGDAVRQGEPLCDVEAAKTTVEVGAPCDGILQQILVPSGTNVPVNTVIAVIGQVGAEPAPVEPERPVAQSSNAAVVPVPIKSVPPKARPMPDRPGAGPQVEPRARRAARERGLELVTIIGSGPGGRIIEEDVLRAATPAPPSATASAPLVSQPRRTEAVFQIWRMRCDGQPLATLLDAIAGTPGKRIPLRSVLLKAASLALDDAGLVGWHVQLRTDEGVLLAPAVSVGLSAGAIEDALLPFDSDGPCLVIEPLAADGLEDAARFDSSCAASLSVCVSGEEREALVLALVVSGAAMPSVTAKSFLVAVRGLLEMPFAVLA